MTKRHPGAIVTRLLSPTEASVVIPAGRPDVYATIEDPTTYPAWLAGAQHIRAVDPEFPKAGSGFDHEVGPSEAVTIADDTVAEGASRPERLDLEVHAGPFTGHVEFHLHAVGDGTKVVLRERAAGAFAPFMPLLRFPLYLRNRGSLDKLRARFAAPRPASPRG
jgi:Polyketide cyclase / dehydrase and lipid transport